MADLTLRILKGSPLTNAEVDANFSNLNADAASRLLASSNLSDLANAATARTNLGLGNVENKSSDTIRSELTSLNVTTALGFTPYNATNPSGYITASASITGNAATATKLATARTIAGVSFDGTANIEIPFLGIGSKPTTLSGYGITDAQALDADLTAIAALAGTTGLLKKTAANTWTLDTSAYLTGITSGQVTTALGYTPYNSSNPSGYITSSASITGNAATATALQTARTINGVSFNGTANITVEDATKLPLSGGTLTGALTVTGTDQGIVNQFNGNGAQWYGRILSKNSTSDRAAFLGTYGNIAGVFAHNNALSAWTDLYVNTVDGSTGGTVRMPSGTLVNGNQVLHAGNYTSYSPSLTGSGASGTWGINVTGSAGSVAWTSVSGRPTAVSSFTNDSGYITGINSSMVTTALGYTPYNSTNPSGYITSSGSISGNAGTVTNGVYTIGDQSIGGAKTFTGTSLNVTGVNGSYTGTIYLGSRHIRNVTSTNSWEMINAANSAVAFTFDNSGNFTAAANVTAYSDERLKKDWANVSDDFVERLAGIKHGTYTRTDSGERQAGASAQGWQELLPEVVMANERGTLSLAYGNAAVVAAIKLAQRVVDLEARLRALEAN